MGILTRLYTIFLRNRDEIWHAGDIGGIDVAAELAEFKKLIAVHGNIDGQDVRVEYPQHQRFFLRGSRCLDYPYRRLSRKIRKACCPRDIRPSPKAVYFRSLPYFKGCYRSKDRSSAY